MAEPWIKLKLGTRRSDKLGDLPSDSARLGYVYALLEAKVQRRMGTFANRTAFVDVLGRYGRYFSDYVRVGLLHVAPLECEECARRHRGVNAGVVVVHDFLREQRDPTNADRQDAWRNRKGDEDGDADSDAPRNGAADENRNAPLARARAYAGADRDRDRDNQRDSVGSHSGSADWREPAIARTAGDSLASAAARRTTTAALSSTETKR